MMESMLATVLYFIFIHLSLLIPGYTLVKTTGLLRKHPGLELSAAYGVSLVAFALFATLGYVLHVPHLLLQIVHWALILIATFFFFKQKLYRHIWPEHRLVIGALMLMSAFGLAFITLSFTGPRTFVPDPEFRPDHNYEAFNVKVLNVAQTNANDNYVPYRQAQFMVNRSNPATDSFIDEWGVHFFQRTPLMGAVTAQYFVLLGDHPPIDYTWSPTGQDPGHTYLKFQIIAHILNALFIVPAFFLLGHLFNRRTAVVSLLFMIPSHFFLYNAFFSWPKSLVAFFILFSWLLLFQKREMRYLVLAAAASGVAYLAHDLAVLYIGASVLLLLYFKRFRDIFIFGAINALFALPWLITSALIFKKPSTFIYYPFSIHGIPQVSQKDEVLREFFATSPLKLIAIRLESMFYLLSPYQIIIDEGGQSWARRLWAASLFNIPGAIGAGLVVPALLGAFKKIRDVPFWILALVPIILCTVIIGWPNGLGALHFAEASVVLFIGLSVSFLLKLRWKWWLPVAFLANCVQLVWFGIYSYGQSWRHWLGDPSDLVVLAFLVGVLVLCGWAVAVVAYRKEPLWKAWLRRLSDRYVQVS